MTDYGPQDWSNVYDALAHARRRELLRYLTRETVGPVQTESLARHLWRDDSGGRSLGDSLAELRHVHLPKLREANLLTWREGDGVVVPTPFAREAPSLLYEPARTLGGGSGRRHEGQP